MERRSCASVRRSITAAVTTGVVIGLLTAAGNNPVAGPPPLAGAQDGGDPSATSTSTTTATTTPAPGATVPGDVTTPNSPGAPPPADPAAATTTLVIGEPDPFGGSAEGLSSGSYGGQGSFDPGSRAVLGGQLSAARRALGDAELRYAAAQGALDATSAELADLAARIGDIGEEREDRVADATAAKASFQRRAVAAYVRGDDATRLLSAMGDPVEYNRARQYLTSLATGDREAFDEYRRLVAGMDREERRLVDDQTVVQRRVDGLAAERLTAFDSLLSARRCVDAFAAGSHVCPPGFTFPVLGEVTFADTWGAPRMPGTPDQHWHEGTDIMAPEGREIVAVEDGIVSKVGSAGLGGLRLWLTGTSGTEYYYAHFSRFAEGMVDGTVVTAGTVLGDVGSTGNAAGGAPHLHFEVHPAGGGPVNPAPLLKAAWGRRAMAPESAIMERVPSVLGTLPPEER